VSAGESDDAFPGGDDFGSSTPHQSPSLGDLGTIGSIEVVAGRLLDVESIKNLKASYFRYLDRQQWKLLAVLFTTDASF
jgi:hypothetical protein